MGAELYGYKIICNLVSFPSLFPPFLSVPYLAAVMK